MAAATVVRAAALAMLAAAPAALARDGPPPAVPAPRFEPVDARLLAGEADRGSFFPRGLAVGPDGCPVIVGQAWSRTLPLRRPLQVRWAEGVGPFVMKLDPTGTRVLFASSLGGSGNAIVRGCAVGPDGDIYVLGRANSDLATTPGVLRATPYSASRQTFLCRIDPDEARFVYTTFLPDDSGNGSMLSPLAVGPDGSAFVAGRTRPDWIGLGAEPDTDDTVANSVLVSYAARISPDGSKMLWARALAPAGSAALPHSIVVTRDGDAVVAGWTASQKFPRVRSSVEPWTKRLFSDGFVVRFDSEGRVLHSGLLGFTRWGCVRSTVTVDAEGTAWTVGNGNPVPPPENRAGRVPADDDRKSDWIRIQGWSRTGDEIARLEIASDRGSVLGDCAVSAGDALWILGRSAAADLPPEQPARRSDYPGLQFLARIRSGGVVDSLALGVHLGGDPLFAVAPGGDLFVAGGLAVSEYPDRPNAAVLVRMSARRVSAEGGPKAGAHSEDPLLLRRLPGWRPGRWWETSPRRADAPEIDVPSAGGKPEAGRPPIADGSEEPAEGEAAAPRRDEGAPGGAGPGADAEAGGMSPRKGRLADRPGPGKDRFRLEARVTGVDAAAALANFDPSHEPLRLTMGDALYPFLVEIPAGDTGWKERGASLVWESPAGGPFRARIAMGREDGRLEVEVSGFDFPGPQRNPIQVVLEGRSPLGAHADRWTLRGEGRFVYR